MSLKILCDNSNNFKIQKENLQKQHKNQLDSGVLFRGATIEKKIKVIESDLQAEICLQDYQQNLTVIATSST